MNSACWQSTPSSAFLRVSFSSVQSLSRVQLFVTPWIAACQASLSITISQSLPKLYMLRGEGNGNPLQFLAWRTPWTEEPGRLQSMGSQESDTTEWLSTYAQKGHKCFYTFNLQVFLLEKGKRLLFYLKSPGLLLGNHFSFREKELIFQRWKRKASWLCGYPQIRGKGEGGLGFIVGGTHVFWHIALWSRLREMLVNKHEH